MIAQSLGACYHEYIACLNRKDWSSLRHFVSEDVRYNEQALGFEAYRDMLIENFENIPDLQFRIGLLVSDGVYIASRLSFDCTPKAEFLGLPVNGRRLSFTENVFYQYQGDKIAMVWSVIDKVAVEAQLGRK